MTLKGIKILLFFLLAVSNIKDKEGSKGRRKREEYLFKKNI